MAQLNRNLTVAFIVLVAIAADARADGLMRGGILPAPTACRSANESFPQTTSLVAGGAPPAFDFLPMGAIQWSEVFPRNFVDLDPTNGILDWDCTDVTYDGHTGMDTLIRGFGEQAIGVPVFAAADGVVSATHDGEQDMNTQPTGQPSNFVTIDHGNGWGTGYWHLKKNSILVQPGMTVRAGRQIASVGSSGPSQWPHMHFEVQSNFNVIEPSAGNCNPGTSLWTNQIPIQRGLYVQDFGVAWQDLTPANTPPNVLPRSGQLALTDVAMHFWAYFVNLPGGSQWRVQFKRPDGTLSFDTGQRPFGIDVAQPWTWWWWTFTVPAMHTITGTWTVILSVNNVVVAQGPIEVRTARTPDFNRPPNPISVTISPSTPQFDDALVAKVNTSLVNDDPDYDLLSYEYVWSAAGVEVRHVTTAGHADILMAGAAQPGQTVTCRVTPKDSLSSGPQALASVVMPIASDLNSDGKTNGADIASYLNCIANCHPGACCADINHDGAVNSADSQLLINSILHP